MDRTDLFPVPAEWAARARMNAEGYEDACRRVESDPDGYWTEVAGRLDWMQPSPA
jgi:acetyl-CoA synthetase